MDRRNKLNLNCLSWCSKSMFRTTKRKKKGEKAEQPSSPKVTCIGQVRVKSKKQGKRLRSRSRRRGDVSFRQEQRWVQLPVTICRAFGADLNCLLPCRSSASTTTSTSCCGPRWSVPRDVEVMTVVEKEPPTTESCRSRRRHVFEDVNIEAEGFEVCAPPKNALLLMRCRSDPLKMASLANHSYYHHNNVKPQTLSQSNLGKQETAADSPPTQYLLNQDIEDTTESEPESEGDSHSSEQESETQVQVQVEALAVAAVAEVELGEEETAIHEQEPGQKSTEEGASENEKTIPVPECLMLMMYEPKLSMEVSKETWVCTTDFIKRLPLPERPPVNVIKMDVQDERISTAQPQRNKHPPVQQPPRSSCSYPAPPPTSSQAFEPLALTRCKSEPERSASKLAPDACSWKMKIDPLRPGIGAAVEADHLGNH